MLADVFGVDDSLIMDRGIIIIIIVFRCFDVDADNYIGYDEFIKGMSVYLKGRYEDKLKCLKNLTKFVSGSTISTVTDTFQRKV
jgi:hypothetical protein